PPQRPAVELRIRPRPEPEPQHGTGAVGGQRVHAGIMAASPGRGKRFHGRIAACRSRSSHVKCPLSNRMELEAMIEFTSITARIRDLRERSEALRGYL